MSEARHRKGSHGVSRNVVVVDVPRSVGRTLLQLVGALGALLFGLAFVAGFVLLCIQTLDPSRRIVVSTSGRSGPLGTLVPLLGAALLGGDLVRRAIRGLRFVAESDETISGVIVDQHVRRIAAWKRELVLCLESEELRVPYTGTRRTSPGDRVELLVGRRSRQVRRLTILGTGAMRSPSPRELLMRAFDVTEDELAGNRAGRLGARQRDRVRTAYSREDRATLFLAAASLFITASAGPARWPGIAIGALAVGTLARREMKRRSDAAGGDVTIVEGKATLSYLYPGRRGNGFGDSGYQLGLGSHTFKLSPDQHRNVHRAFAGDTHENVRAYYTPRSGTLVALELV